MVWQHVIGKLCVLFAVLGATGNQQSRTQHNEQYTHRTYDMVPHHRITYNEVDFLNRILIQI